LEIVAKKKDVRILKQINTGKKDKEIKGGERRESRSTSIQTEKEKRSRLRMLSRKRVLSVLIDNVYKCPTWGTNQVLQKHVDEGSCGSEEVVVSQGVCYAERRMGRARRLERGSLNFLTVLLPLPKAKQES